VTVLSDCFVSVVAPLQNDAPIVRAFVAETMAVLRRSYTNYELVLVDDGSVDATVAEVASLLGEFECVRLIRLSREFGEETAITAGLDSVIGDFVVVMLPNHDPPALIPSFVERARSGTEVVFGVRRQRSGESLWVRLGASVWYWYSKNFLKLDLPRNSSQFRALSRQAVNSLVQIRDKYRYLRLLSSDVGYAHSGIEYEPVIRNPDKAQRSFADRLWVSIDIVVANSQHPLRFVVVLGIVGGILNLFYAAYVIAIYFFKGDVAAGWTTLSLQNAGMFFLIFLILTVLSEYIGHILVEARQRPLYYVLEERNSPLWIADQERRNVVLESHAD